jgi:hypothetical protein
MEERREMSMKKIFLIPLSCVFAEEFTAIPVVDGERYYYSIDQKFIFVDSSVGVQTIPIKNELDGKSINSQAHVFKRSNGLRTQNFAMNLRKLPTGEIFTWGLHPWSGDAYLDAGLILNDFTNQMTEFLGIAISYDHFERFEFFNSATFHQDSTWVEYGGVGDYSSDQWTRKALYVAPIGLMRLDYTFAPVHDMMHQPLQRDTSLDWNPKRKSIYLRYLIQNGDTLYNGDQFLSSIRQTSAQGIHQNGNMFVWQDGKNLFPKGPTRVEWLDLNGQRRSADWRWSQGRLEVQAQSKPGSLLWIQSAQNQRLLRVQ